MNSEAMQEVVGAAGLEAALILAARYGGQTLHVPEAPRPDHPLTIILGEELAQDLADTLAGVDLELPQLKMVDKHRRNEEICRLAAHSLPVRHIARVMGVGERQVRRVIREEWVVVESYRKTREARESVGE